MPCDVLLVHISDLHFGGEVLPSATTAQFPAGAPRSSLPPPFQGFYPHDIGACDDLRRTIQRARRKLRPTRTVLAITGDLSLWGADSEFALANTYLRAEFHRTLQLRTGLAGLCDAVFSVPGNHDHWRGSPVAFVARTSPNLSIHGPYFRAPWWCEDIPLPGRILRVLGLDSCAGLGNVLAARGRIDPAHLKALEAEVRRRAAASQTPDLRVLLLHHPPVGLPGLSGAAHELDDDSRRLVDDFARAYDVRVVLTGHTHAWSLPPSQPPPPRYPVELRCGTTLQGTASVQRMASPHGQCVLLHRLELRPSNVSWTTEVHQRRPGLLSFQRVDTRTFTLP